MSQTFNWAITPTNHAPTLQSVNDKFNTVGQTISLPMWSFDLDNDPLTYSAAGLPPGLGIDATSGEITGTLPDSAYRTTPYQATVTVSDGSLRTTASISRGRNGNSRLRLMLSARDPWNRPQSSRIDLPQASSRCIDPVTVWAAPQKVTVGSAEGGRFFAMRGLYTRRVTRRADRPEAQAYSPLPSCELGQAAVNRNTVISGRTLKRTRRR